MIIVALACAMFSVSGCRRHDFKEHVIHIPEMSNEVCAQLITTRLLSAYRQQSQSQESEFDPVKILNVDMTARTVTLRYESLIMARKNLDFLVADMGFDANGIPGNKEAAAKLDPRCGLKGTVIPAVPTKQVQPSELVPIIPVPAPATNN